MMSVASELFWVWRMRPFSGRNILASKSVSCFRSQLTLPRASRWHLISTMEPRFLATKRGCCQIREQMLPVGAKAGIKILPLVFLTVSPNSGPQPWAPVLGSTDPWLRPLVCPCFSGCGADMRQRCGRARAT